MSEPRRRKPGALPVVWASGAAFLVVFGGLAAQLRDGGDPALGNGPAKKAAAQPAPRRVLVRRIIEKRVVVRVIPAPVPQPVVGAAPSATAAPAGYAPVNSAPASVSGPAPASAPA
ncbi:MAG: hypothetical protein QOF37_25, partial [Thermoleophilaceae bacterium]|nr:hypothetical protein [Thermoleophilaceae bacterium]